MRECDIDELRKVFRYDPETGRIYRWLGGSMRWKEADERSVRGYLNVSFGGRRYRSHRVAWAIYHGEWPSMLLDHINGQRDDNRIANLREVTHSQNMQNITKKSGRNSCKHLGVFWRHSKRRWVACITVDYKTIQIGSYRTEEEAYEARCAAVLKYFTHSPLHTQLCEQVG